ncbi:MAG TPA: family 16 glycoside hydrolase [Chitinophagaceae bacterium]|nr:family 16 glycoside hydrolase [Chitinophagaceae bacterium]
MRKIFYAVVFMLGTQLAVFAQSSNNAAISTILNSMPAQTDAQLTAGMQAITALGGQGIVQMVTMLKNGGDNTALEYAIGSYAYYVTQPGKEAQRTVAVQAFCTALSKVQGSVNKQFIIKQLQQMGTDDAVPVLKNYLADADLSGAAARALLQIGTPAAKAALQGDDKDTKVIMYKPVNAAGQVQDKTAQLYAAVKKQGSSSMPLLQKAMHDDNAQYRQAALWYAKKFQTPAGNKQWLALLPSLTPAAKVQVIDFVAASKDAATLPAFTALLNNADKNVRLAAIAAAGKAGNEKALPALLNVMKTGDADEIAAVKNAILVMRGDGVMAAVAKAFPGMPSGAKAALLDVIAARRYDKAINLVVAQLQGDDLVTGKAAGNALPAIAGQEDLPALFDLLDKGQQRYAPFVQDAVIAASSGITDTAARTGMIIRAMDKAGGDRKYLYLKPLAAAGGKTALAIIASSCKKANCDAAIDALATSKEANAARILLAVVKENAQETQTRALNAYINVIKNADFTADEKLLMLKEAMPFANTNAQQEDIMQQVGGCNTLPALIYAGNFLDNGMAKPQAAQAVMHIALSHREFNGDIVRGLLTKASSLLNDNDADYERQAIQKYLDNMPAGEGFVSMFNGKDLAGWKGLVENPVARAKMPADTLAAKQAEADKVMREGWRVEDGMLIFTGHGENLCTVKKYADFDMYVDWKIKPEGDAGIYLRGSPQVQIWDTSRRSVGAEVGSGGLYNNQKYQSKPLVLADNAIGEWNSFHIIMRDDKVTVYLNGVLVTDNVTLENYWNRSIPIFPKEQIELQAHGNEIFYRGLYIKELTPADPVALSVQERKDGFTPLFDGSNLDQWTGDKSGYRIDTDGSILVDTTKGNPGNMYTKDEYSNFVLRFQFKLTPGANNGIGIRAPLQGDAAYAGMEIQVLDNEDPKYKDLHVYQYHGSVYGVIPAKRGFLKPTGQWNEEEIVADGPHIKVTLNGEVILDGNIDEASKNGTADHRDHPGLKRTTGHIGFLGHGDVVSFKNVRIKNL